LKNGYSQYQNGISCAFSWFLTSMTDNNGNTITLTYKNGLLKRSGVNPVNLYLGGSTTAQLQYNLNTYIESVPELYQIIAGNDTASSHCLTFTWMENNSDPGGSTYQSFITTITGRGRTFNLNYNKVGYDPPSDIFYYRYFLGSFTDGGCGTPVNYQFSYNGISDNYTYLPDSTSNQYDYWGYYNATASIIPAVYVNPSDTTYQRYAVHSAATAGSDYIYTVGTTDMMADTSVVMMGTLNEIKYAEGGSTTITYQSNDYIDVPSGIVNYGGGIRVRQIVDYDGLDATKNIVRNYSYVDSTGKSSGKPISLPVFAFTIPYSGHNTLLALWQSATAISNLDLSTEDHTIEYKYVRLTETKAGSTLYQFYIPATNWDKTATPACSGCTTVDWRPTENFVAKTSCTGTYGPVSNGTYTYPFVPNANYDFERGLPQKVSNYNDAGAEVSESDYSYERSYATVTAIPGFQYDYDGGTTGVMSFSKFNTYTNTSELTAKVINKVFDTLAVYQQSTTNYVYGSPYHKLLTSQNTVNSDGTLLSDSITYTKDYVVSSDTNANINALYKLQQHNVNVPVETWSRIKRVDTTYTTAASLNYFKVFITPTDTLYLQSQQYKFVSPNGYKSFVPMHVSGHTLVRDTSYVPVADLMAYDSGGSLLTMDDAHHHTQSSITNQYAGQPAITITNAAYNEIAFTDFDSEFYPPYTNFTLSGTPTYVNGHTGQGLLFTTSENLTSQTITKNTLTTGYIFSVWVNSNASGTQHLTLAVTSAGTTTNYTCNYPNTGGAWQYYQYAIPTTGITTTTFTVKITTSANIDVDDFIFYPNNTEVTSYSYDPVTHIRAAATNTSGISTYYDYDTWGRLLHTYDQYKEILKRNTYFAPPETGCTGTMPGYVKQDIIKTPGVLTDAQADTLSQPYIQTSKLYYDGLGRSIQLVAMHASPLQNDIIQPFAYDNLGRQLISYLPYGGKSTDTSGNYRANAITVAQPAFYDDTTQHTLAHDSVAYISKQVESSPLQRVLAVGMVGKGFQPGGTGTEHYKTLSYRSNSAAKDGNIVIWNANGINSGNYTDHELSVTDGKDEDGTEALIFKDFEGRMILKRQLTGKTPEKYYDTYYIYNNAGSVDYVVPPKAIALLTANPSYTLATTSVNNLLFKYTYDKWGRVTSKTSPGNLTNYTIYDPLNRPVLTQNPKLREGNQWYYIKYDAKGRTIATGIYFDNNAGHKSLTGMQAYVSSITGYNTAWYETRSTTSGANNYYYTNAIFPTTNITGLAYNYYDNYQLKDNGSNNYGYKTQGLPHEATPATQPLIGLPTMSVKTSMGPGFSTAKWILSVTFYDKYGHTIQTRSNNQLYYTQDTLTDTKTTVPDFTGRTLFAQTVKVTGTGTANTNTIKTIFTYDSNHVHLISFDQKYNSQSQLHIATYSYNEINQLVTKQLGYNGTSYLQTPSYRYNIRGQLTSINNSKLQVDGKTCTDAAAIFGMTMLYDQTDSNLSNDVPSYSGRMTAVKWMVKQATKDNERSYVYAYDKLDRYINSRYAERSPTGTGSFSVNTAAYNEGGISYDENGNILTLHRKSLVSGTVTDVDALGYTYDSANPNQLDAVKDTTGNNIGFNNATGSTGSYSYDSATGNLSSDPYKGINLKYNSINRIDSIVSTPSLLYKAYVSYTYDATGNVMRRQVWADSIHLQSTNDYIDGMVYTDSTLSYVPMPEGRVIDSAGTLKPEYVYTDPQGNARYSFRVSATGAINIIQENSYYAFGEALINSPVISPTLPNYNLYNGGSERQSFYGGLPDYDQTFYRNYDPATGRFIAADPMAESAESMSTYQYAMNNPVMNNDPLGNLAASGNHGNLYGKNSPVVGFPKTPNEFGPDYDEQLQSYLYGVGFGAFGPPEIGGGGDGGGDGGSDYTAFWTSAISYLNDIARSSNADEVQLNGVALAIGSRQEQLITNGDAQAGSYGLYSNGSLSFEGGGSSSDGSDDAPFGFGANEGGINNFSVDYKVDRYWKATAYGAEFTSGVQVTLKYNSTSANNFVSYNWVQTYRTDWAGFNPNFWYVDGDLPYYYKQATENSYSNSYSSSAYFYDNPASPYASTWVGEVTLVGIDANKMMTPLGTFNYGFNTLGWGYTWAMPIIYSDSPSPATGNYINMLNAVQTIINSYK
jgi:RHS repeat-associated protein